MESFPFLWRRLQTAYRMLALLLPLFVLGAVTLAVLSSGQRPSLPAWQWLAALVVTAAWLELAAWWVRKPTRPAILAAFAVFLGLGSFLFAIEFSFLIAASSPSAMVAVMASLLAVTGTMALAAFPLASLAWALGFAPSLWFDLFLPAVAGNPLWWVALVALAAAWTILVWSTRTGMAGRLGAEARSTRQTHLVGLLLHDWGEGSQHWTWEADPDGRLRAVSPRVAKLFARQPSELEGVRWSEALVSDASLLTVEDEESLQTLSARVETAQIFHDLEVPAQVQGSDRRWKLSGRRVLDDFGKTTGWIGIGIDITESEQIATQNRRLAIIDNLTGLVNRRKLQEVLHDRLSPRAGDSAFSLLLIDLQNFRMVNEGLGHEVGDRLLSEVARRLRPVVPNGGLLSRLGGDEFALLVPGAEPEALDALAAALRNTAVDPFLIEGHRVEVTYKMGRASAPQDGRGATELLKCAELALHEAKLKPEAPLVAYHSELGSRAIQRIRLHNELKTALLEGQFELHYQPQIRVLDGTLSGSEALVRWRHPERGMVSPAEFIPALEETGLIVDVGLWILGQSCREALQWPADERVAVNVSAVQFASRSFLDAVKGVLEATGLPPARLELEITESVMAQDSSQVVRILKELRQLGIAVALDDFGTGYSSLSYLRQLPLDKLKVDQSFVRVLDQDPSAASIIQAVLDLARALGLKTTAEGVETEEQRARLSMLGVDTIQGYFYSRPLTAQALAEFRATRASGQRS